MRKYDLKPFKFENDRDRKYDILRSVLLENSIRDLSGDEVELIKKRFSRARNDTSGIENLKKDFQFINDESVFELSERFDVTFKFYTQNSSRFSPIFVKNIGEGPRIIHLKIKCLETETEISFSNLWLLREMEKAAEPCNFLKSKLKKCYSLLNALKIKNFTNMDDETFFQEWGSLEIKFGEIRQFAKLFGFSFAIWTDETKPSRVRCAYLERKIDILLSSEILKKQKLHIHDEFYLVLDPSYLRVFSCKTCNMIFKSKYHCSRHEKSCLNGTKYTYKEVKYGRGQNSMRKMLVEKGLLTEGDSPDEHFVSFDIESLNTPSANVTGSKTVVQYIQEVNLKGMTCFD